MKKTKGFFSEFEIRIHEIEEEMCMEEVLSDYIRLDTLNEELIEAKENSH